MLESKFKFFTLFAIILSLFILVVLMFVVYILGMSTLPLYISILLIISLFSILSFLIFSELRDKAIKLKLDDKTISIKNFIGLGKEIKYNFKEFDGYKFSLLSTEEKEFEYLYLLIAGKKIIRVSEFYHSNYADIKNAIKKRTRHLPS